LIRVARVAAGPDAFDEYFCEVHGTKVIGFADTPEVTGGGVYFLAQGCILE
jgi:hypothetical protein